MNCAHNIPTTITNPSSRHTSCPPPAALTADSSFFCNQYENCEKRESRVYVVCVCRTRSLQRPGDLCYRECAALGVIYQPKVRTSEKHIHKTPSCVCVCVWCLKDSAENVAKDEYVHIHVNEKYFLLKRKEKAIWQCGVNAQKTCGRFLTMDQHT